MTQYRQIDREVGTRPFVVDGVDVQYDWHNPVVGHIVQIALKEEVRPPSNNAPRKRLMAPYVQKVIVSPEECTTCAHDIDNPNQTICPNCVDSWCLDWLVRYHPNFNHHGTASIYTGYGCRCPECRWSQKSTYGGKKGEPGVVRGNRFSPTTVVPVATEE